MCVYVWFYDTQHVCIKECNLIKITNIVILIYLSNRNL